MIKVLEERKLSFPDPIDIVPVASERLPGRSVRIGDREVPVLTPPAALEQGARFALFSAGAEASRQWAPVYSSEGITVIDNSSAWRREAGVPLIVPEVNGDRLHKDDRLIANPNCSTIQLVAALAPLHRQYRIRRIVVSTYQSVTGSGMAGLRQLMDEREGLQGPRAYPHPIDMNLIPQGGNFLADGSTTEEDKLVFETRKILDDQGIGISATVVRVPVRGGHSESVNVSFHRDFEMDDIYRLLRGQEGLKVVDDPGNALYPMPLDAEGKDEVFIGRIRRDASEENALNLWVVSDNLRKGAATNAVQIALFMAQHQLV